MGQDRSDAARSRTAGSVKELIGKLIGDKRIEDEGASEKNAGLARPAADQGVGPAPGEPD